MIDVKDVTFSDAPADKDGFACGYSLRDAYWGVIDAIYYRHELDENTWKQIERELWDKLDAIAQAKFGDTIDEVPCAEDLGSNYFSVEFKFSP